MTPSSMEGRAAQRHQALTRLQQMELSGMIWRAQSFGALSMSWNT